MFDQTIDTSRWACLCMPACFIRGCPNEQNIALQAREQKKCVKFWSNVWWPSDFIKHDQKRSNSTKQGVQKVKCFVTKQCLMVSTRQTFPVCPGLNVFSYINHLFLPIILPYQYLCVFIYNIVKRVVQILLNFLVYWSPKNFSHGLDQLINCVKSRSREFIIINCRRALLYNSGEHDFFLHGRLKYGIPYSYKNSPRPPNISLGIIKPVSLFLRMGQSTRMLVQP